MRKLFLIFVAFSLFQNTFAQEQAIQLSSKRLDNKNVEISYEKIKPGSYTVAIKFDNLTNTSQSPETIFSVYSRSGILMTMKPTDQNEGISYSYKYNYVRGKLNPKVKENFCYILPYKVGKKVRVFEMGYLNEKYFGAAKPSDWKSYLISTNQEDTVTAVRKGIVVEIVDKYDNNSQSVVFTTEKNTLIVEHEDGTLLRYSGFKRGSITVQPGEDVLPGSVLGINSPNQNSSYSLSLLLYYLNTANFETLQGRTLSSPKSLNTILTPKFTFNGTTCELIENKKEYTVFNSEEIITRELSKKEVKKYQASKGNN